ncbi:MAG: magnesium transporter [Bacteroidales bacterium]|nr:magnesium transporter [Bacteroidales bacterium]
MIKFELTREYLEELKKVIAEENKEKTGNMIIDLHPADIAEVYDELNIDEAKFVHLLLDNEKGADVLVELEEDVRTRFMKTLPSEVIAKQFIDQMDSDDAADVIGELPEDKKDEVLSHIEDVEQAGDIVDLLSYDEDTAGGLMAKELIAVNTNWNILTCIKEIRKQAEDVDDVYFVYVIDNDNVLKGIISLKKLLLIPTSENVSSNYDTDVISVKVDTSSEDVANLMDKYDLVALPVVDSIDRLVGRITIDDVLDVIREEAEKDYQLVSGITEDVEPFDKVWRLTRARLPWLLIGLFGGILGAKVIGAYEGELRIYPEMAFFIPLIAAMGGNVGVQSSSIIVQGLANNTIGIERTSRKLLKEFSVAIINGFVCSTLMFIYNIFFSDSLALTLSVSAALLSVILFASIFGTFIPLILDKYKIDPALATGPFITTVNDILGLFIYLSIGRVFYGII